MIDGLISNFVLSTFTFLLCPLVYLILYISAKNLNVTVHLMAIIIPWPLLLVEMDSTKWHMCDVTAKEEMKLWNTGFNVIFD